MKKPPYKAFLPVICIALIILGYGAGYTICELTARFRHSPIPHDQTDCAVPQTAEVCFTPNKECQIEVINQIDKARRSIYVQAYAFTDRNIAQALVKAAKRGVDVKVILEKATETTDIPLKTLSSITVFLSGLIIQRVSLITKVIIIDEAVLEL